MTSQQIEPPTRISASYIDDLTGLLNRRSFLREAALVFSRSSASDLGLAAILLDLDRFKKLNKEFGRAVGDEALRAVACIFRETLCPQDLSPRSAMLTAGTVAGRYGGEEFAAIIQCPALADACRMAQRIQSRVQAQPLHVGGREVPIIISLGVFFTRGTLPNVRALLRLATRSLQRAKHNGRDCWVCEEEP